VKNADMNAGKPKNTKMQKFHVLKNFLFSLESWILFLELVELLTEIFSSFLNF
jgi:hypothetical protein